MNTTKCQVREFTQSPPGRFTTRVGLITPENRIPTFSLPCPTDNFCRDYLIRVSFTLRSREDRRNGKADRRLMLWVVGERCTHPHHAFRPHNSPFPNSTHYEKLRRDSGSNFHAINFFRLRNERDRSPRTSC